MIRGGGLGKGLHRRPLKCRVGGVREGQRETSPAGALALPAGARTVSCRGKRQMGGLCFNMEIAPFDLAGQPTCNDGKEQQGIRHECDW